MMSIRRAAAADETRLLGNQLNVIPVANPARIVPEKWTQVRSRSRKARILAPDYYDLTPQITIFTVAGALTRLEAIFLCVWLLRV
jgi:hypothetical protein